MKKPTLVFAVVMALALCARAEVVATARSPEGKFPEFRVALEAEKAPVAVANFMGLLDGSQRWVDPETGLVRGGEGDAFYGGMVFDWNAGSVLRGALKGVAGTNGTVEYTGRPGYTIRSEVGTNGWNTVDEGTLAYVERMPVEERLQGWMGWEVDVLGSGGGELALFLEDGMVPWTVFGHVAAGDEENLWTLADAVAAGVTAVEWSVDTAHMTEAERVALERARAELPVAEGIEARVRSGGGVEWEVSGKSQLTISKTKDMKAGWKGFEQGWNEGTEKLGVGVDWEDIGLKGDMGFASFAEVRYPAMAGETLEGKWQIGVGSTELTMQYWLDFDGGTNGGTGMWAQVESGTVTKNGTVSQVKCTRATANSLRVEFGLGGGYRYYWFRVTEDGAGTGRFQSVQVSPLGGLEKERGWYEWKKGWGEGKKRGVTPKSPPPGLRAGVPWGKGAKRQGIVNLKEE